MNETKKIIDILRLKPLPIEGGYYKEIFQSEHKINSGEISSEYSGKRLLYSTIYYLITVDTFSALHQLPGDEIFHFYKGDPVEMLNINEDGSHQIITIGNDILNGEIPQILVKGKVWQGCKLKSDGQYALLGTTMSPGFDYEDYVHGKKEDLLEKFPHLDFLIKRYTHS